MKPLSVIIITKDAADVINDALASVAWADEIIIVDSESTDDTLKIASTYTSKIFKRTFDDFSAQKNFALGKCRNKWVFSLDGDERVSPSLKEQLVPLQESDVQAYRIKRENYIFGRHFKHGGNDSDWPIRLFHKDAARFVQPIHEFLSVQGRVGSIEAPIIHCSTPTIKEYLVKLKMYTKLEAQYLLREKKNYSYLKRYFFPAARFIEKYFLKKGFMDGKEGLIFYLLSSYYEFLKWTEYKKLLKLNRIKSAGNSLK